MQWPLAPSELSLASSFISVSAPETGDDNDSRSREEKGKAYTEKLKSEINDLLASGASSMALNASLWAAGEASEVQKAHQQHAESSPNASRWFLIRCCGRR